MGWKIVRDRQPGWCLRNGVSGQWRGSRDPGGAPGEKGGAAVREDGGRDQARGRDGVAALGKKIGEEYGEYVGDDQVDELYDLRDVIDRLIELSDPDGTGAKEHADKVAELGGFTDLTEWCPVPMSYQHVGGYDPTEG